MFPGFRPSNAVDASRNSKAIYIDTEGDVLSKLRERGVRDVTELRYVLYETKGDLTIVPERGSQEDDAPLVAIGLRDAAGFARTARS